MHYAREGGQENSQRGVGIRLITIIVTIGPIYKESRIMPEMLRPECILQSKSQRNQQYKDWPSSAQ